MRRIIERVVTVVTTTTWTISWQDDSYPPTPKADSIDQEDVMPVGTQTTQSIPPITEIKEADDPKGKSN